ncbi:MAG TPA: DinB family protein [Armatimonadota bacterium]
MGESSASLKRVYEGWEGFNTSLVHAVELATPEALDHRLTPDSRSAREVFLHIAMGRIGWFLRMDAPGCAELAEKVPAGAWRTDSIGNRHIDEAVIGKSPGELVRWLQDSWAMVDRTLTEWTVDDLWQTRPYTYFGKTYALSRQWILWRIQCHDIYHGGQLTLLLGSQGIELPELHGLGGHLTEPPVIGETGHPALPTRQK